MRQAYWDMLEEELEKGNTIVLICQLQELQDALVSIHDISITDSIQQINDNKWTHDQAWELYTACISFLCHCDSESHKKIYKESIEAMNEKTKCILIKMDSDVNGKKYRLDYGFIHSKSIMETHLTSFSMIF